MKLWKKGLALTLAVLMTGCAGSTAYQKAKDDEAVGHWDMAVMNYAKALELNPENAGYKAALARAKLKASQVHFERGKMYRASGRPDWRSSSSRRPCCSTPPTTTPKTELRKVRGRVRQAAGGAHRRDENRGPQEEDQGRAGRRCRCSSRRAIARST